MVKGLVFFVAMFSASLAAAGECRPDLVNLKGDWGQVAFSVEVADTPEARAKGLMSREFMPRQHGMLFIFESPRPVAFWMKNTLIPLDMLFATQDGTVARIHHLAQPLDETPIPGGNDIKYVLEINGGLAKQYGITAGSVLQHPAISQDIAAWPCGSE